MSPPAGTLMVSATATEVMIRQVTAKQMHFIDLSPYLGIEAITPAYLYAVDPHNSN
jgi:hypothetical protein